MITEGVIAETGYEGFFAALAQHQLLPGLCRGVELLKRDESRHIAYGVYLISRLVANDPSLLPHVEETMRGLLPVAMAIIEEAFSEFSGKAFNLDTGHFADHATSQFEKRLARISRVPGEGIDLVFAESEEIE